MNFFDFMQGFLIGSSLIIAIGPQNLFVIQQGLKNKYIFITVLICSLSDALLIIVGITLSSILINIQPTIFSSLKIIAGIWLFFYGFNKIKNSRNNNIVNFNKVNSEELKYTILNLLAITYLNPHVYLDTVILLGTISSNFSNKIYFGIGAILASINFFFLLGYLSKLLSKIFKNRKLWFWIDNIIGLIMIIYGIYFILDK